jgi:hypothetical protein
LKDERRNEVFEAKQGKAPCDIAIFPKLGSLIWRAYKIGEADDVIVGDWFLCVLFR